MMIILWIITIIFPMFLFGQLIAEKIIFEDKIQKEIDKSQTQNDHQQIDDLSNWEKTCQQINHSQQKI